MRSSIGVDRSIVTLDADLATTLATPAVIAGLNWAVNSPNEVWIFEYLLRFTTPAAGFRVALTMPSGTFSAFCFGTNTAVNTTAVDVLTQSGTLSVVTFGAIATPQAFLKIGGTLYAGNASGMPTLSFASKTAGQTTTIMKGSYVRTEKVG